MKGEAPPASHPHAYRSLLAVTWTLLLDEARPGWENMAIDSALLDFAVREGGLFLRLYQWAPYCLSFGRHEPALRRYDAARIRSLGIDWVRRPTGGRAVWHARELTYSVTAPVAWFGGMKEAYREIHEMLAAAVLELGAVPALALAGEPRSLGPAAGPCFASPAGGEVLVGGRKVVGSAQLRRAGAFLQHGSLLLQDDQTLVGSLAGIPPGASADAPLSRLLGRKVEFEEAAAAVSSAAEARLGTLIRQPDLPAAVRRGAETHAVQFRSDAWTWQR